MQKISAFLRFDDQVAAIIVGRVRIFVAFLIVSSSAAISHAESADFENFKDRLVGTWSFIEDNKTYEATFEAVSHGHALLERNSGFIAVYFPNGDHGLLMTLYTRDGNQPQLRAEGFGENPASIRFKFRDITNWKKGTEHINGLEFFFKDHDHVTETWETLKPNGTKERFGFELTRKGR